MIKTVVIHAVLLFMPVLLISLPLSESAHADDGNRAGPILGYKAGIALSSMTGESADEFDRRPRIGPALGSMLIYPIHESLELQAELLFSMKGLKRTFAISSPEGAIHFDETVSLYCLELPLLARFPFPLPASPAVTTYGGVSTGIVLTASASGEYTPESDVLFSDGQYEGDIANYRRFDFEVILGGDIQFPLGNLTGFIDVRYMYGLVNMFGDVDLPVDLFDNEIPFADYETGTGTHLKNGTFTITFGIIPSP